ncbi:glycerol-3-phosphate dehydrogenase/oxidase [Frigidibacter sp. MR17.24]|uniref:glycerol-3-phosphate dehydrogenase/oxidase n=1 Tax=Frigidibacter sp. MR17.24 TaxID=3127345 RepID=UPI00301312B9
MRSREELIAQLRTGDVPPVLIIGGGINGVGTYRDLAAQGVPALLVEAGDFASGTSSAPSRLIHGGLRYLETGEAALVRESLTERNLLLKNACHVVHPQPCWVPLRSWLGGTAGAVLRFLKLRRTPGRKGAVPVKIGLMLYDRFGTAHQTMPGHRLLTARQARGEVTGLAPDIRAVAEYHDARITHPERLVMELVADAEADCPKAMALNYLRAGAQTGGRITLTCQITGERFEIAPRIVVNATGAWVDEVQGGFGFNAPLMGGTRGSHLVIRRADIAAALGDKMLYFETDDHRACLIYRMEGDRLLLGTTDIRADDPGDRQCTEAEIDYLFEVLRPILPGFRLHRSDVVFAFAGVRPLPRQDVAATGAISRDHKLVEFAPTPERPFDLLTLVGGKWTTYRVCAEQIADAVLQRLGRKRQRTTEALAIGGAQGLPFAPAARESWARQVARDAQLPEQRAAALTARYGSRARAVAAAEAGPQAPGPLTDYSAAEIGLICRDERVARLEDIVLRRTLIGFEGDLPEGALARLAAIAGDALGWDDSRRAEEQGSTSNLLRTRHLMTIA